MLNKKIYVIKSLALISILCSGLSVGKEGPLIHLAGCVANRLPYRELEINKALKHQFITAALAIGITSSFGAPIGGILFSIELNKSFFSVENLHKSSLAVTATVLFFKTVGRLNGLF